MEQDNILLPISTTEPKLNDKYQCIDHVSLILNNDSIIGLANVLNENNIKHELLRTNTSGETVPKITGVTVAYSKNRLYFPFGYNDLENNTMYFPFTQIQIKFCRSNVEFTKLEDNDGVLMDVMVLKLGFFNKLHKSFIEKYNAEWSLGEFVPFIKLNSETKYKDNEIQFNWDNLKEFELVFDIIRYMRFAELKS